MNRIQSAATLASTWSIGDLIALLDAIAADQEKVLVVRHDWGAIIAWYLCLFGPDRLKALVNLSKPQEIEADFAQIGTEKLMKELLAYRVPGPRRFAFLVVRGRCQVLRWQV
ncbi:hypothetical protein SLEP1_g35633 [Rubroshorea leprosula]|uniref:Uncharacterized protein n=1 Tax=Rubroshorea leprosula TaxID=152421 RepID=A0AAV5KP26_9ROSI|nr:hypothetical protein SLEP1_g35633 [Rubroshorea leprosula]